MDSAKKRIGLPRLKPSRFKSRFHHGIRTYRFKDFKRDFLIFKGKTEIVLRWSKNERYNIKEESVSISRNDFSKLVHVLIPIYYLINDGNETGFLDYLENFTGCKHIKVSIYTSDLDYEIENNTTSFLDKLKMEKISDIILFKNDNLELHYTPNFFMGISYFSFRLGLNSIMLYKRDFLLFIIKLASTEGIKLNDSELSKNKIPVSINIPQKILSEKVIKNIDSSSSQFAKALGLELEIVNMSRYGSFFKNLTFKLSSKSKEEINDVYKTGKKALESFGVDKPKAEATNELSLAAERLISSIKTVEEAVIRIGAIIIVKTKKDNSSILLVDSLSIELMHLLDKNPKIIENPKLVFDLLNSYRRKQPAIDLKKTLKPAKKGKII